MSVGILNSRKLWSTIFGMALSIIYSGCDPHVEMTNPDTAALFSVTSFISPQDTILRVYLYRASELNSTLDPDASVVKNAFVTITNGVSTDTLVLNSDETVYESGLQHIEIVSNVTYHLSIRIEEFAPLAAECTIPIAPQNPSVTGNMNGDNYLFQFSWQNPSSHPYYAASARAKGQYEVTTQSGTHIFNLSAQVDNSRPIEDPSYTIVATGKIFSANQSDSVSLTGQIWNLDSNLYQFYDTWDDYDSWLANSENGLPNLTAPTSVFSNVKNGTGIFGAFNRSESTVKIK